MMKRLFSTTVSIASGEAVSPIVVACILERLPIVVPSPPQWEVDHHVYLRQDAMMHGLIKDYDEALASDAKSPSNETSTTSIFVPVDTSANEGLPTSSMRRKLSERLYLMVKPTGGESSWQFPSLEIKKEGESVREAGERALSLAIKREKPIYFLGNAPLAHVPSTSSTTFFMLAQIVGEPFDAKLKEGWSAAAWMTKSEILGLQVDKNKTSVFEKML